jgi:hypothetical protein
MMSEPGLRAVAVERPASEIGRWAVYVSPEPGTNGLALGTLIAADEATAQVLADYLQAFPAHLAFTEAINRQREAAPRQEAMTLDSTIHVSWCIAHRRRVIWEPSPTWWYHAPAPDGIPENHRCHQMLRAHAPGTKL